MSSVFSLIIIINYIYKRFSRHSKCFTLLIPFTPVCSIHLDDATAAIVHQNAHHTPAHWWRGDSVMKSISVWGWLGGHDGQRSMGKFGQDAGVKLLFFFEGHPGIFNDHRVSGPRFNVSSERQCFFYSIVSPSLIDNHSLETLSYWCTTACSLGSVRWISWE